MARSLAWTSRGLAVLLLGGAATLFLPAPPAIAQIQLPSQYRAERDPFRSVTPGQTLTFELYGDRTCSARPVHIERLVVGQSGLYAERVELEAVHQQTRVTANATRLSTMLAPPAVEGLLYLKVVGRGIVPINAEVCQPQVSAVTLRGAPGTTGPTGPQGAPGPVGSPGPGGPPGPQGPRGMAGVGGAAGTIGPAGQAGPAGSAGPIGPEGPSGVPGPPGTPGPAGPPGPVGGVFKGEWAPATDYQANDVVTRDGEAWVALRPSRDVSPGPLVAQDWGRLVVRGADGRQGPVGPAGQQGLQGSQGAQGPAGAPGATGPQGARGPAGPVGPGGERGPEGQPGRSG